MGWKSIVGVARTACIGAAGWAASLSPCIASTWTSIISGIFWASGVATAAASCMWSGDTRWGARIWGQLAQLTAQYSFCEMEGCEDSGKKMAPMELRDHVSAHLTEKDLPSYACQWKGCAKKFEKFPNYLRHINNVHLKLLWKCMSCDARHKSQKEAMACCNKTAVPEPLLWTLGCKCAWNGCNESFKTGDGEMLRAHLKAHLEAEGENPFECRWGHGRCGSVKGVLDSKVKLVRHLEQVHGRLRYKCVTCGKTKALNKKKEIINCGP